MSKRRPQQKKNLRRFANAMLATLKDPSQLIPLTGVCTQFHSVINAGLNWEALAKTRFMNPEHSLMALQNLEGVMELPQTLWKRLYVQLHLADRGLCSICAKRAGSYQQAPSQLRFCLICWNNELLDEETAMTVLKSSLGKKYQELEDMDMTLLPSFSSSSGKSYFYLRCDVNDFLQLLGHETAEFTDAYNTPWRKELEQTLLQKGVDWQKASSYALNLFPPEGSSLASVTREILAKENMAIEEEEQDGIQAVEDMTIDEPVLSEEVKQKEWALREGLERIGLPWETTESFPYARIVEQFLQGKGPLSLEDILGMMSAASRHTSIMTALDTLPKIRT